MWLSLSSRTFLFSIFSITVFKSQHYSINYNLLKNCYKMHILTILITISKCTIQCQIYLHCCAISRIFSSCKTGNYIHKTTTPHPAPHRPWQPPFYFSVFMNMTIVDTLCQ